MSVVAGEGGPCADSIRERTDRTDPKSEHPRPERRTVSLTAQGADHPGGTPMNSTADNEKILRGVLDEWKAAVDAHEPERVADCFTEDAIFQGLHPYGVGRQGIAEYYASQPLGMTADYRILETRQLADGLVLGYMSVDFSFTGRPTLTVYLSLVVAQTEDGWYVRHYQVSRLA
jgi:uncharacterized protein (TIGR02246 family)